MAAAPSPMIVRTAASLHKPAPASSVSATWLSTVSPGSRWFSSSAARVLRIQADASAAAVAWVGVNTNTNEAIPTGTQAVVRNYKLGGGVNNVQGQKMLAMTTVTIAVAPVALVTMGAGLTAAIAVPSA